MNWLWDVTPLSLLLGFAALLAAVGAVAGVRALWRRARCRLGFHDWRLMRVTVKGLYLGHKEVCVRCRRQGGWSKINYG